MNSIACRSCRLRRPVRFSCHLAANVVRFRLSKKVSLGMAVTNVNRAIRAHGNCGICAWRCF